MMWWNDSQAGAGSLLLMTVMMVLFWGGLIALGAWLVHTSSHHEHVSQQELERRHDMLHSGRPGS
jgi:hypothetical protein